MRFGEKGVRPPVLVTFAIRTKNWGWPAGDNWLAWPAGRFREMETLHLVWDTYIDHIDDFAKWRERYPHKAKMMDWVEDLRAAEYGD